MTHALALLIQRPVATAGRPRTKSHGHDLPPWAHNLRRLRISRGLTQAALAGLVGVHYRTVCRHETGAGHGSVTAKMVKRYADALCVAPNHIYGIWEVNL